MFAANVGFADVSANTATDARAARQSAIEHWAFHKPTLPAIPAVKDAAWVANPIDNFILAKLQAAGLSPSPPADRRTLIRRVTFDLIGLPPTPQEVDDFVNDESPDAYEKVVDRLLASPHYGERWGRHWLDVARYADSKGYVGEENRKYPFAYAYRDWVIGALNEDLPYDQFLLRQIAADQLPQTSDNRSMAAMGFLTVGGRFNNHGPDIIDDRIDVVCRGTMALTVGCTRCHDHKFDPIPTADYYSLYSIFANSMEDPNPPVIGNTAQTPALIAFNRKVGEREKTIADFLKGERTKMEASGTPAGLSYEQLEQRFNTAQRNDLIKLRNALQDLKATDPAAPPQAMSLIDRPHFTPQPIFLRGNEAAPGPVVPAQFLSVLSGPDRKPFSHGSGRLDLAEAIASKDNPLTARVMVNRIWLEHFGAGIVDTPSDFGMRGDPPTHPELLDWLAIQFMNDGWSMKKLHRLMVLSSTYRQCSEDNAAGHSLDSENRLLWRMNRRRLDFEATHDELLAAGGNIDLTLYGRPVQLDTNPAPTRRAIYGFIDRQNLASVFRDFDFPGSRSHCPRRFITTVPQQSLYFMNGRFVIDQARRAAQRPEVAAATDDTAKIAALYRMLFQRAPDEGELQLGKDFLRQQADEPRMSRLAQYAQVLLESNEFVFLD